MSRITAPSEYLTSQADDGVLNFGFADLAAIGDHDIIQGGAIDLGAGQETRPGVDAAVRIIEVERRFGTGQFQVDLVEGADGADILPIAVEIETANLVGVDGFGDHLAAKIVVIVALQQVEQHIRFEEIDAHGAQVRTFGVIAADEFLQGFFVFGFLNEIGDQAILFAFEQAQLRGSLGWDRLHGHGDIGVVLPMEARHAAVIHAVEVVAGQDEDIIRAR